MLALEKNLRRKCRTKKIKTSKKQKPSLIAMEKVRMMWSCGDILKEDKHVMDLPKPMAEPHMKINIKTKERLLKEHGIE